MIPTSTKGTPRSSGGMASPGMPAPSTPPSSGGMAPASSMSQLAQLFLSGPQKPTFASNMPSGAGPITNPTYPTIQMPTPSKSVLPSQAATTAPAQYTSQKGETPLEGGGYF